MKRQPMPPRRTALARGAVRLTRRTPLARTSARLDRQPSDLTGDARKPAQDVPQRTTGRSGTRDTGKAADWTQEVRETVRARSGGRCEIQSPDCLGAATNLHHRLPKRMGGSKNPALGTAANALHVCGMGNASGCHRWLDLHSTEANEAGWKLRAGADPAAEPAMVRGRLTWLTEGGKYVGETA